MRSPEQLRKAEVIALELRIYHLAVTPEINAVKAAAESLDVTVRELRSELREHGALQLEPFVGEVAAVMIVVNHHQRPRARDEVAACERGQAPRFNRFESSVDVLMPLNHPSIPGLPPRFSQAVMEPNAIRSLAAHTSLASG
jgi:hypothetical protein